MAVELGSSKRDEVKERSSGYDVKANVYRSDSRPSCTRLLLIDFARPSPFCIRVFCVGKARKSLFVPCSGDAVLDQTHALPLSPTWNGVSQARVLFFRRKRCRIDSGETQFTRSHCQTYR